MARNIIYQRLLKKMFILEVLGERLYSILASKTKRENLKLAYRRLAFNEYKTLEYIEKEFFAVCNNNVPNRKVISGCAKFIFNLVPARQLSLILKSILKRRLYSRWFNINKDKNRKFWDLLLEHENMQYELLRPIWNQK
jgi:hypothetical protein